MPFDLWSIDSSWYVIIFQLVAFSRAMQCSAHTHLFRLVNTKRGHYAPSLSAHCSALWHTCVCMAIINYLQIFCSLANTKISLSLIGEKYLPFVKESNSGRQASILSLDQWSLMLEFIQKLCIRGKYQNPRTIKAVFLKELRQTLRYARVNWAFLI